MVKFKNLIMGSNPISELRNKVLMLMAKKTEIETQISEFYQILSTNNVGMHEPLVDAEGFPRNDIDVYQVRTARHKIICLQTDHKNIMQEIEDGLHNIHAKEAAEAREDVQQEELMMEAFAVVTLVSPGSPADVAGLQVNDTVVEFGSVNKSNFKSMKDVATVVRSSVRQTVFVTVNRKGRRSALTLSLVPQTWSGQGFLGCKIDPLPSDNEER